MENNPMQDAFEKYKLNRPGTTLIDHGVWLAGFEAGAASVRAASERLADLVRYARHFLHDENLISDEEYAAIVQDNESGQRVARLEGYDKLRAASAEREKRLRKMVASWEKIARELDDGTGGASECSSRAQQFKWCAGQIVNALAHDDERGRETT